MKGKVRNIWGLTSALFVGLLLSGCVKEVPADHESGAQISFGASTTYSNGVGTRTEYSGEDEEGRLIGTYSSTERIDWIPEKDRIRILCGQATGETDYKLTGTTASGAESRGHVAAVTGNGLEWGANEAHYFYSAYPGPGTESVYHGTTTTAGVIELLSGNKTAKVTGTIPAAQTVKLKSGTRIYKPDMNLAYMYAMTKKSPSEADDVKLEFRPLVTTFEFRLKAMDAAIAGKDLKSLTLSSTSTKLSGGFTATLNLDASTEAGKVVIATTGTLSDAVTVSFPSGTRLSETDALTVTVLTLPVTQTDLTLVLTFDDGAGGTETRTLELKRTASGVDTPITVDACKKIYLTNVGVPGSWEYHLGTLDPVELTYEGGDADLATGFVSYRTRNGVTEPVAYKLQYSATGEDGTWVDADDSSVPDWISVTSSSSFAGSVSGETLAMTVDAQVNSMLPYYEHDPHTRALYNATPKTDFDLSTINVATGETVPRSTANCYVVQAPGTYKFPMVRGNAIRNGAVNMDSFFRILEDGSYRTENQYYNLHYDNQFYMYGNFGVPDGDPYLCSNRPSSDYTVVLEWEDVEGLINVDAEVAGDGEDAYITFSVPQETIAQGNAGIVAYLDGSAVWSWHIWVTDEDLTATKSVGNGYSFAPVNIGWCDERITDQYDERSYYIRAVQMGASTLQSDGVLIKETAWTFGYGGNNPFYCWGARSPAAASNGNGNVSKNYFGRVYAYDRSGTTHVNNWDSSCALLSRMTAHESLDLSKASATKTVKDPSPVGYQVPPLAATSGWQTELDESGKGGYVDENGNGSYDSGELFFPFSGLRHYSSGALYYVGEEGHYWLAMHANQGPNYAEGYNFGCAMMIIKSGMYTASEDSMRAERTHIKTASFSVRPIVDTYYSGPGWIGASSGGADGHQYDFGSGGWQ